MFFHGEIRSEDEVVITSMRHTKKHHEAYDSLKMYPESLEDDMPEDFIPSTLRRMRPLVGLSGKRSVMIQKRDFLPNLAWKII